MNANKGGKGWGIEDVMSLSVGVLHGQVPKLSLWSQQLQFNFAVSTDFASAPTLLGALYGHCQTSSTHVNLRHLLQRKVRAAADHTCKNDTKFVKKTTKKTYGCSDRIGYLRTAGTKT